MGHYPPDQLSKNYYHILGISSNATATDIKAAYKRLALKFHPDKNPGNVQAEERFKQVNEAYQVLSSSRRRAAFDLQQQYDQHQRQAQAYANPRYHYTRQPAGYQERHYRQRPQKHSHFSRRDMQIVVSVVVLVILLLIGLKVGWDRMSASRAMEQAEEAVRQQQWQQAEKHYSTVIGHQPDLEEARLKRAHLRLHQLHDLKGAAADFTTLLQESDTPQASWYASRGNCYLQLKKYGQALQDLDRALQLDSTLNRAYHDRGVARLQLEQDWETAISDLTHYLQSISTTPAAKPEAHLYRAYAYYRTQQWAQAWQDTEQALAKDAYNAKGYYLQAIIKRAQKGIAVSCDLLAKAAQLGFPVTAEEKARYCP